MIRGRRNCFTLARHIGYRWLSSSSFDLKLYDSLSESTKDLPLSTEKKELAWYTCGPTTYAPSHLGHARTYVCLDIIRRVLESSSAGNISKPLFCMNITDVDDKILAASKEQGVEPLELARKYEADFWRDMDRLNCKRPHVVTRVTECVESDIIPYIEQIQDRGMAYVIEGDGVYFDLRAYETEMGHLTKYGKLAPPAAATEEFNLWAGEDGNNSEKQGSKKKDPRDFVLWKIRPDDDLVWDSKWGKGRPGWHIECSAMIHSLQRLFSETHTFLVHAGGIDLKFPHHTNEIAQAEAHSAPEGEWIPHWVHTGHLYIEGLKMSKSLKNFISIEEMLDDDGTVAAKSPFSSPADDFRMWCLGLAGSYRGSATYSEDRIEKARQMREKLVQFLLNGSDWVSSNNATNRQWNDEDYKLFQAASQASVNATHALKKDFDGSAFVQELMLIAQLGSAYMISSANDDRPVEPMIHALDTLRTCLDLVGFSATTVRTGLVDEYVAEGGSSNIRGGERAIVHELVRFRDQIRQAALREEGNAQRQILQLCDDARDTVFPSIGLELLDGKQQSDNSEAGWRFCPPRISQEPQESAETPKESTMARKLDTIPLENFFKMGQYEGKFSEFDEKGIPTLNADGTEVSNRLLKKLMKKRKKQEERIRQSKS